jgi:hypothetical protein
LPGLLQAGILSFQCSTVHLDLKPGNILLAPTCEQPALNTAYGVPKIADFGLARSLDISPDSCPSGGTPEYMTPEQAGGAPGQVGPRADVYGLGAILYKLLTGRAPFQGKSALEVLGQVRASAVRLPRKLQPDIPAPLEAICPRCLTKAPQDRFASARELGTALEGFLNSAAAEFAAGEARPRSRWTAKRKGMVAALLAVAIGGGTLWWNAAGENLEDGEKSERQGPSLQVKLLKVFHFAHQGNVAVERGVIGEQSMGTTFGDYVRIDAVLSDPAYAYLLALDCNGKVQMLLPVGKNKKPDESARPIRCDRLEYPARTGKWYRLDDNSAGGLQAFAVVASSRPLPSYAEWRRALGKVNWRKLPAAPGVWSGDAEGVYPVIPGKGVVRGQEQDLPGAPPLCDLCRSLAKPSGAVVEVLAFPVWQRK